MLLPIALFSPSRSGRPNDGDQEVIQVRRFHPADFPGASLLLVTTFCRVISAQREAPGAPSQPPISAFSVLPPDAAVVFIFLAQTAAAAAFLVRYLQPVSTGSSLKERSLLLHQFADGLWFRE